MLNKGDIIMVKDLELLERQILNIGDSELQLLWQKFLQDQKEEESESFINNNISDELDKIDTFLNIQTHKRPLEKRIELIQQKIREETENV